VAVFESRRILPRTDESAAMVAGVERAFAVCERLNRLPRADAHAVRAAVAELTGVDVHPTVRVVPPLWSDHGRSLRLGERVFLNHGCTINDLGGVVIGDDVLIGPNVQILSAGHPADPAERRDGVVVARIEVGRGVWIGAGATVLQGVSIGEDSVVAAGAVVTRDVPDRVLVAGVPARVVREL
jgi:acetyltransferase-like isoleucine patch superfamily enzyme